jgi:5-(carboxyamino)imidazole ribonucleotide mutase
MRRNISIRDELPFIFRVPRGDFSLPAGAIFHRDLLPRRLASGTIQPYMSADLTTRPLVGIIMGSKSDWETLRHADEVLNQFGVPHECQIVSAHRTPQRMVQYATEAEGRGLQIIIAGAGGAAHLPGMVAANTVLPVIGVPVQSAALNGLDSLLSIVQMPGGIPVGTTAIGKPGAINAALLAVAMLANHDPELRKKLKEYRANQTRRVLDETLPGKLE